MTLLRRRSAFAAASLVVASLSCAIAPRPAYAGQVYAVAYVDFPAAIDPGRTHRHIAMKVGSRLYYRPQLVIRQLIRSRTSGVVEQAILVDAASTITRLGGETLVVEPDGSKWRLSPVATIQRGAGAYKYVVIDPDVPLPGYLRSRPADVFVR